MESLQKDLLGVEMVEHNGYWVLMVRYFEETVLLFLPMVRYRIAVNPWQEGFAQPS
jgi:hypothetical protein